MKIVLCENTEWLLSEEAFSIYASCMYHPTYEDFKVRVRNKNYCCIETVCSVAV